MARNAISTRTRFEIFKRDGFACQYCGSTPPRVVLHIDHIVAVARGGTSDIDNLVTSCSICNMGKAAISLSATPQALKDKAKETAEREAQILGYQKIMDNKRLRIESEAWVVANVYLERFGIDPAKVGINRDYLQSIKRFIKELGLPVVRDAMDTAVTKRFNADAVFRYFCGICWRTIRGEDG